MLRSLQENSYKEQRWISYFKLKLAVFNSVICQRKPISNLLHESIISNIQSGFQIMENSIKVGRMIVQLYTCNNYNCCNVLIDDQLLQLTGLA